MKLLFVVHGPVFGGGQNQLVRLRAPLAARGWSAIAVAPRGSDAEQRFAAGGVEVEGIPLHRLRATPDPRVQLRFAASLAPEVAALRRVIRRHDIDVVQVHGDTNPHGAIAAHLERRAVVWQLYDTRTPVPLRRVTMPLVTRVADVITTWGRGLGEAYPGTASLGERWIPVFPPVADGEFSPARTQSVRAAARRELDVPDDAHAVGIVGMRNPTKGHEQFVRALALVRERRPDVVGRILGPPSPAHAEYEARFRAEAAALGLKDGGVLDVRDAGTRVADLLPALDVLVLSSVPLSEGMPTVILEAMAAGIPVVATDVGAVRELVADGETGFVVAPLDPRALADAVLALVCDADRRAAMGAAGRARFERRFSLDALADVHERAYALAVAQRQARGRRRGINGGARPGR